MRIFLDANILFSAAQSGSRMSDFLDVLFDQANCLTNVCAVEEVRRNLELKSPEVLYRLDELVKKCKLISAIATDLKDDLSAKDIPILGGAIAGQATHLLTGDKRDFGVYFGKTIQGVKIVSPIMLVKELKLS